MRRLIKMLRNYLSGKVLTDHATGDWNVMRIWTSILGKYTCIAATILLLLSSMVISTFYLTEEIQGEAMRINLAGRQRMHVFHLALHAHFLLNSDDVMLGSLHRAGLKKALGEYEQTLLGLRTGSPECDVTPSCKASTHDVLNRQLDSLITLWNEKQKPQLLQIIADPIQVWEEGEKRCHGCHDAFIPHFKKVDDFVFALSTHNEQVIQRFNVLRFGILVVSALAAIAMAIFIKQQMILPVQELYEATVRLENGDFSCALAPRTNDEIGTLALAFNRMSTTLAQSFTEKEALVQQRTAELQTANEDLRTFAYTVSHDLRAPLRAIQGFAEAIREDGQSLDLRITEHLTNITAAAEFMDKLILDLLSYSRISYKDIHIDQVDTGQLFKEVVQDLSFEIQKVEGQVTIEGCLPVVMANHGILTQITMNLLSNAIKYVKAGTPPRIQVWAQHNGDKVRLFVKDNGIGIAPEDQHRIFDVFVRLHGMDSYPGTGIGLATVHRGIERLGGSCGVESIPSQGSTFWLELSPVDPAWLSMANDSLCTEH
ncbi:MAG: HAMP domain-containing protein [Desulfobulbaceae bacterium]|nr:HAMP domain-containing protein [Desulfobulbaceae bacterium]